MLRGESPSGQFTDEVSSHSVGTLTAGLLIFEPVEPRSNQGDQISLRDSDLARTYHARCALTGVLSRHGRILETVEPLLNGSRFEVALVPKTDMLKIGPLRHAVTALIDEIERANKAFQTRTEERRHVVREVRRLLSFLCSNHQRLVAPGIQAVVRPALAQFRLFEEPSARSDETVVGVILSIDRKHHQVMVRGNKLVEGVSTEGLEVGQQLSLRCTREGLGKIAVYRAHDLERDIQTSLNLSSGSGQR